MRQSHQALVRLTSHPAILSFQSPLRLSFTVLDRYRLMPTLAKTDFGPNWCFSLSKTPKGGPRKVGRRRGSERWGPEGWEGPKFRAFSSLSHHRFALFVSLWVSSRGILVVFGSARRTQMCTFGVLGLSCEAPAAPKPPGFHTTAREPKRAHLRVPVFTKTTKIQREGRGKKKERSFGRSVGGRSWGRRPSVT